MRVTVDQNRCNGYGNCVMEAPEVFDLDGSGLAIVKQESTPEEFRGRVEQAVRLCPVQAITLEE